MKHPWFWQNMICHGVKPESAVSHSWLRTSVQDPWIVLRLEICLYLTGSPDSSPNFLMRGLDLLVYLVSNMVRTAWVYCDLDSTWLEWNILLCMLCGEGWVEKHGCNFSKQLSAYSPNGLSWQCCLLLNCWLVNKCNSHVCTALVRFSFFLLNFYPCFVPSESVCGTDNILTNWKSWLVL